MSTGSNQSSWRSGGGGGGGAPAPPQPPTGDIAAPSDAPTEDDPALLSTIRHDRMHDVNWVDAPTYTMWIIISRREKKMKVKSRMPVILRNLMPDSIFDPRDEWAKRKQQDSDESINSKAAEEPAAEPKGKKNKKEKEKKLSKKDEIIAKNEASLRAKEIASDWEKLDNLEKFTAKGGGVGEIIKVKTQTAVGELRKLLLILDWTLKNDDTPAGFDVFWAIEANKLFIESEASYREKKDEKKDDKKDDKKKKDKKDKKKDDKEKKSSAPLTVAEQLIHDFRKNLKKIRELRSKTSMVEYQLTKMHDRLPPLSRYNRKFRLDEWQCRVLALIDQNKSAIVCAPTSSGKTVISTYVAVSVAEDSAKSADVGGVLFVVPSEPLVWQVAAMFEKMMPGQVALCTDIMTYRPETSFTQSSIVVGTPNALESALLKVRGLVGAEKKRGQDFSQLQGGCNFRYAVYDECHSMDGEEGGALQRLIRMIECPFLALSATIGNAQALQEFWTTVRARHKDCVPALVRAIEKVNSSEVHLERHEGRFINLQRLVFNPNAAMTAKYANPNTFVKVEEAGKLFDLVPLHPCSAVDVETLRAKSFHNLNISFTPRDSFALWGVLSKHIKDKASVAHLEPNKFFAQFGDPKIHQITLAQAKDYESAMKDFLETFAKNPACEQELRSVLQEFAVDPATIDTTNTNLFNFAMTCRDQQLFPCLCFQLDSFKCLQMFKELLGTLESRQRAEFPNYYKELEEKAEAEKKKAMDAAKAAGSAKKGKKNDENEGDTQELEDMLETFIDTAAPHPNYVLSPPNARISTNEFDDILAEMKKDKEALHPSHPLARGLRRGIGIYISDINMSVYRRVVQRLAQQGKLAIVFSDDSLAYGVNMPFRTCAFCGNMGGLLTPLMAQQMSGRTGRRGLDTQGNIVYLGMGWDEIQGLILGQVPDIRGVEQLYPTMALAPILSDHVDLRLGQNACLGSFKQFQDNTTDTTSDYFSVSSRLLQELGFIDEDMKPNVCFTALTACFELRHSIAESLAVVQSLPLFYEDFVVGRNKDFAEKPQVQVDFFSKLLHFIDRHEPMIVPGLPETDFSQLSIIQKYPERKASWDKWEQFVAASQSRIDNLSDDLKEALERTGAMSQLGLPVPIGQPLDATLFSAIVAQKLPADIPSMVKYQLKKRLFHVGTTVVKMHNCLCQIGEFQGLETILRKCYAKIKYMLIDAMANETTLSDQSGALTKVDEDEVAAAAAEEGEVVVVDESGGQAEEKTA